MANDGKTHVFRAKTYAEAVAMATTKLGKDISVVTRRDVREKNLFSKLTSGKLGGESLAVELEVAVLPPEPLEKKKEAAAPNPLIRTYAKALEGAEKHGPAARQAMAAAAAPFLSVGETTTGIAGRLDEFKQELEKARRESEDMRREFRTFMSLQARGGLPAVREEFLEYHRMLVDADVDEDLAREIIEGLEREQPGLVGKENILPALRQAVARRIPIAGPLLLSEGGTTVVALVGPSGVGKSTSVVKLAIRFAVHGGKTVGVVNEDLRRPGADGQINNLGRLFGISVVTASTPSEMRDAVKSLSGRDLILLDTGGRSPRDAAGIASLAEILTAAGASETHLLLSSVSSERMMTETLARYRPAGYNRVVLTKLDECVSFGGVLKAASRLSEGLSYVTTGPDYSRPIQTADSLMLADLALGLSEISVDGGDGEAKTA